MTEKIEITESLGFGMLLAIAGGSMDAYSFLVRGGAFATGQTGNFVLTAMHLANRDWNGLIQSVIPILAFWFGIFISHHLFNFVFRKNNLPWKSGLLLGECFFLLLTGFIPLTIPNIIPNSLISLIAAMQFCAFRSFGSNASYASIFCTGNMRSCAEMLYNGLIMKDKGCLKSGISYAGILLAFFFGAFFNVLLSKHMTEKSIWFAAIILLSAYMIIRFTTHGKKAAPPSADVSDTRTSF